jgi:UDP-N-acetylmuramoylalanine--D-glutamate ligase
VTPVRSDGRRVLVYGLAQAGEAAARALVARGFKVVVADDRPTAPAREVAEQLRVDYVEEPDDDLVAELVEDSTLVVPSPGVPETHDVIRRAQAEGIPIRSEIDLAYEWEQQRPGGPRPMLAITGTDGKTTTTLLAVAMLRAGGVKAIDAGNTDTPLVTAIDDGSLDAFVVECTSFRLAWTSQFRAEAAAWLNLAPDHQDWHTSLESYREAKSRMWQLQRADDVAIGFADDPIVMEELAAAPGRHRTFALAGADYRVEGGGPARRLVGPAGDIADVAVMRRALPHDLTNALAASALVLETGLAAPGAIADALAEFEGAPHRIQLAGEIDGVRFYNDSKATTPHAARTAIRAFDHVVLIAGGKNKGLDLSPMASEPDRMRGVIAIGAAAGDVVNAFYGVTPVVRAESMEEAVGAARALAQPGDTVLLSPGCASFDMYSGYPARGEDFMAQVRALAERAREGGEGSSDDTRPATGEGSR